MMSNGFSLGNLGRMAAKEAESTKEKLDPWVNDRARWLLRKLVDDLKWDQSQVASETGASAFAVGRLYAGQGTSLSLVRALATLCAVDFCALLTEGSGGGIVAKVPSVSAMPGFGEAKATASKGFTDESFASALRMLDAMPAARVDAAAMRALVHIAADLMAVGEPQYPLAPAKKPRKKRGKADAQTLKEEHRAVATSLPAKKKRAKA